MYFQGKNKNYDFKKIEIKIRLKINLAKIKSIVLIRNNC